MKLRVLVTLLLGIAGSAFAQHGTAGNGYYPPGYTGNTWTGQVVSANEQTREITLSYTNPKNGKSQTFIGIPADGYLVHEHEGATRPLRMSDIHVGSTIKVWYLTSTGKVDGKNEKVNVIFQISTAANANRKYLSFMAFGD
ncbi:MAG TPA: hypothetical protein VGR94_06925 [Candidatus Acidoferrales bacterium]|nr:hypothetical protein [Candidatus Acidoferrales bacterium]